MLTVSRELAKIVTISRKSNHPSKPSSNGLCTFFRENGIGKSHVRALAKKKSKKGTFTWGRGEQNMSSQWNVLLIK